MRGVTVPHIVGIGGTLRPHSSSSVALDVSLRAASEAGATTEMLDLFDLDLPMFRPGLPLATFGDGAQRLVSACERADGILWSTSAYHGSMAGVTKNALDFLEFLAGRERTYLDGRCVGLIATAAGNMAAVNAANSMVSVAHALRATVASLLVAIPQSSSVFDSRGAIVDPHWLGRLEALGRIVAEMARFRADRETGHSGVLAAVRTAAG